MAHAMTNVIDIRNFIIGGKATFTIKSLLSGHHITYKVTVSDNNVQFFFISVLTGPDNWTNYSYLGTIALYRGRLEYRYGNKSKIGSNAPSAKAAAWLFSHLNSGNLPPSCEFYHEDKCCRCGRKLTTPESVTNGIGPECLKKTMAA